MARRVFLIVYGLSGASALLYQVTWLRLLALHLGHTVAAAGTVLAAFMGGLALGAALAGRVAPALGRQRALKGYAALEAAIALCAVLVPLGLTALQPVLRAAYADGGGAWFASVRTLTSIALLAAPAAAMGATLPLAVRWAVGDASRAAKDTGVLYAANTAGAALGAAATGFVLLPALGLQGTTLLGVAVNLSVAVASLRLAAGPPPGVLPTRQEPRPSPRRAHPRAPTRARTPAQEGSAWPWLAGTALGVSGFVALLYEVVWTRAFALVLGPTTYAFTTMVVIFIVGIACGSGAASRWVGLVRTPGLWLAAALGAAAAGAFGASAAIGHAPLAVAGIVSDPDATLTSVVARQVLLVAPPLLPMTMAFGAAFPFAVAMAIRGTERAATDVALVYALNTVGAIGGALVGSFFLVPLLGLQRSIVLGGVLLVAAGAAVALVCTSRGAVRAGVAAAAVAIAATGVLLPPWNPSLLSSGAYKYAADAAGNDLQASLEAGELLYHAEGATGTVTVRRVAGTTSLAIDGKVDASNGADMLTQKLLAHLPLMLHRSPRDVAVIGFGSGVTVGAALRHPVEQVDAIEISPEVIAASSFFADENRHALSDPRTRLILADGRTHMLLADRAYDVIISEPSNPWMAGIASLFTREFFLAVRARLAAGGIVCQWAHTYDIGDADLRSIVATFASVFPDGAVWLAGNGDLLLIGGRTPVVNLLPNLTEAWQREEAASDLSTVGLRHPFGLLALYLAGGSHLLEYGSGPIQSDDRLGLEFSAPAGIYGSRAPSNVEALRRWAATSPLPSLVTSAIDSATAPMWRDLGLMYLDVKAADLAYDVLARAVERGPEDEASFAGLSRAAAASGRAEAARALLERVAAQNPRLVPARIALSRLLAATGAQDAALRAAAAALDLDPSNAAAREQLASVLADAADADRLEAVVQAMVRDHPDRSGTLYYRAVLHFLRGEFADAVAAGERAAVADPSSGRVQNLLGAAFANLGRPDRARIAFEASVRVDPTDPSALTNLGMFELEAANSGPAASRFAEALLLDPALETARAGLAEALDRQGETSRAARLRRR